MKKCTRFKTTSAGKRCARFSTNREEGSQEHSMVELSLKGYGLLNRSVNSTDVAAGAAIGLLGSGAVKYLIRAAGFQDKLPVFVQNWMPLLASLAAGSAAYAFERKGNKARAESHLVGAAIAGASAQAWGMLKATYPEYFGDVVSVKLNGYGRPGYGVLVNSPTPAIGPGAFAGYNGMIFNNPGRALAGYSNAPGSGLAGLAALAMSDDKDGLEDLMD